MTSTILLVDDEVKIRRALGAALRDEGYEVVEAAGGLDARRLLGQQPYDALVVDNLMPDMTGLDLIRELSASVPDGDRPQILMMTAHATVDSAIEAMKLGAFDYLQKPFDVDELLVVVRRALEHQRLRTQHRYLLNEQREAFNQYGIVARSARMQEVIRTAELVAESRSTVLITGETGTGKELVARAIHDRSGQREMPLIKVNCAAIPDNLLESELFGHRRGAFTGALVNKKGRFELANGGTIFLDEIGTMSLGLQAKLLRVLQEREFEPLGAERTLRVDVRVIAATNLDLERFVFDGAFAEDLYYRQTSSRSRFRRSENDGRTFRCWSTTSCASTRSEPASGSRRSIRTRVCGCRPTAGPATSESSRTRSSGPSSWPPERPSRRATSRSPARHPGRRRPGMGSRRRTCAGTSSGPSGRRFAARSKHRVA